MPVLDSGLETATYETQGWNAIYSTNFQLLDTRFVNMITASVVAGTVAQAADTDAPVNPAATTAETLTDSAAGTISNTISAVSGTGDDATINNNLSSLVDEINKLRADVVELRAKDLINNAFLTNLISAHNALLVKLRKTGGVGILAN